MKAILPVATLLLAGCGTSGPAENKAAQLDNAAEVSTPAAARVMRNAADEIRAGNDQDAEAETQRAMSEAGNAAARQP